VKSWIAIPVVAGVAAAIALAVQQPPESACAVAALAAALAAVVRAFVGGSAAATVASTVAALLGALFALELPDIARSAFATAAALFVISEIVRPQPVDASPLPSIGASLVAGVLDPSFIALVPVVGVRFILGPWSRPRGSILLPIVGVLATGLAILAATLPIDELWSVWTGKMGSDANYLELATRFGDIVGPIAAVAAIAGFATMGARGHYAIASVAAVVVGAVAVDLETGSIGVATLACAAFGAGLGVARLTAMLRWPAGQAAIGAAAGFMMLVAPALTHWLS
jgi:hypothetical protein